MTRKIHEKGLSDEKYKQPALFYLKKTNAIIRPYLMKDQFNREINENVKFQLSSLDKQFENSMNQDKPNMNSSATSFLTSIV